MLKRLKKDSYTLEQRRKTAHFQNKINPFFQAEIYDKADELHQEDLNHKQDQADDSFDSG